LRAGSLTQKVAEKLRGEIRAGKWDPERPLPSERALAEQFEMSRVTARRCLQALCREGLLVARAGSGYFPVCDAGGPETLRTRRAVIYYYASEFGAPVLDRVHASIINGANAESIRLGLNLYTLSRSPVDFLRTLGNDWGDRLRGVVLDWATLSLAEQLRRRGIPFVVVEEDIEGLAVTSVIQDNAGGTRQALAHMAERGHRRLGILLNERDETHTRRRLAAYRGYFLEHDLPSSPGWVVRAPDKGGRAATAALLDHPDPPTALFVAAGGLLPGVMEELSARGLTVPDDLSLVVWGAPALDEHAVDSIPISRVTWSGEAMGRLAIRALENMVQTGSSERMVLQVKTELIDRGSVRALAVEEL